ncbi:MAG: glycosyltransferase family 4 protein, partial [Ilumatobacteraceae bacterium]
MLSGHDGLVVEALEAYAGERLPTFPGYELIRDLPDPVSTRGGFVGALRPTLLAIRRVLARRRQLHRGFDVAHIQTLTYEVDAFDLPRLARRLPVVAFVHDVDPHVPRWPHFVQRFLLHRVYSARVDFVVAHPSLAARLQAEYGVSPQRIHVVPLGLDAHREVTHCSSSSGPQSLLFLGTLRKNKGLPVLLDAFAKLPPGRFRLTVAGRGDAELERRAQEFTNGRDDVSLEIGLVTEDRKWQLLSECDVVVLPYESFASQSAVLMEAYSARRPVVVTDVGAIGHTVREDRTGVVVAPGRADALLAGLIAVSEMPRAELAESLDRAAARYDYAVVGRQLRDVY